MNWFDFLKGTGSSSSPEPSDSFEDIAHMLLAFPTEELELGHFIEEDQLASDSEEERILRRRCLLLSGCHRARWL